MTERKLGKTELPINQSNDGDINQASTAPAFRGVMMGGSGSTGSSLLRTVLNRHPDIFSGEELNFLNKQQFFDDWNRFKKTILGRHRKKMATRGFFPYPGDNLLHTDYGWDRQSLTKLVEQTSSLSEFLESYFAKPLRENSKSIWIEKTPSNCYCFRSFLESYRGAAVIHTTRHPLDAVASMVRRGMNPYFASGLWLYNTAAAVSLEDASNYLLVRYESFTANQQGELRRILKFLGVSFLPEILCSSEADNPIHAKNPGWRHDRTTKIQATNVRTFELLSPELQRDVKESLSSIYISRNHAKSLRIKSRNCADVCRRIEYEFRPVPCRNRPKLVFRYVNDMFRRTWKRYPTRFGFYPLEIRSSS